MVIYTKKGDQGFASILSGERVPKDHEIIILMNNIDSLQSALDLTIIDTSNAEIKTIIDEVNEKLWQLAAEISNQGLSDIIKNPITEEDIKTLEKQIDTNHPKNAYFIRFTKKSSVRLNEARVRTRILESALTKQLREEKLRPEVYKYINRLSDLLYALACKEEN